MWISGLNSLRFNIEEMTQLKLILITLLFHTFEPICACFVYSRYRYSRWHRGSTVTTMTSTLHFKCKDPWYDIHHDSLMILSNVPLKCIYWWRRCHFTMNCFKVDLVLNLASPFGLLTAVSLLDYVHHDNGQTTATTSHIKNDCLCSEDHFQCQTWRNYSLELAALLLNRACFQPHPLQH